MAINLFESSELDFGNLLESLIDEAIRPGNKVTSDEVHDKIENLQYQLEVLDTAKSDAYNKKNRLSKLKKDKNDANDYQYENAKNAYTHIRHRYEKVEDEIEKWEAVEANITEASDPNAALQRQLENAEKSKERTEDNFNQKVERINTVISNTEENAAELASKAKESGNSAAAENIKNTSDRKIDNLERTKENAEKQKERAIENSEKKIDAIKNRMSNNSSISSGKIQTESVQTLTEEEIAEKNFNSTTRELGSALLFNGIAGEALKYFILGERSGVSPKEFFIFSKMEKSSNLKRIISSMKGELRKREPDKDKLKSLKMEFRKLYYSVQQMEK